ncbi:hypothetical protein B566_EDAN008320 [Ephemera danica]|nr:hypothetical protein B566_EDAN008320 [Ephemera danica]
MTILPGDGSCSGGSTPVPCKRQKLSLKYHSNNQQKRNLFGEPSSSSAMDSMSGITAFFPASHRIGPFAKYEPEPSRSSGTDESPASEATSSSERNANPPVMATLANMGNTCFLNSVLYTLRFAPQFMHQLHHVVLELATLRPSSSNSISRPQRTQFAMERLHELYQALRGIEDSKDMLPFEPLQPLVFFNAFREVNPMFETHQQHDAHELLVALLDNVRDTCLQLREARQEKLQQQASGGGGSIEPETKRSGLKQLCLNNACFQATTSAESAPPPPAAADCNFITKDFEGVTVLRTTCLECETATERKETFCDICVPIQAPNEACSAQGRAHWRAQQVLVRGVPPLQRGPEEHQVRDAATHPHAATQEIHLKVRIKLSSPYSVSKVNDFMPTPLVLSCFCETCCGGGSRDSVLEIKQEEEQEQRHSYQLFAAIMHLGATMASGHYVSFVRATDNVPDYCGCVIHQAALQAASQAPAPSSGGKIRNFFKPIKTEKPTHSSLGMNVCPGTDCCGIRLAVEQGVPAVPEPSWLECDDDSITVMSKAEFEDIVSQKRSKYSSLTPYLLFYVRAP